MKKSTETYKIYIFKVLKHVHPDIGIPSQAMGIMNSFNLSSPYPNPNHLLLVAAETSMAAAPILPSSPQTSPFDSDERPPLICSPEEQFQPLLLTRQHSLLVHCLVSRICEYVDAINKIEGSGSPRLRSATVAVKQAVNIGSVISQVNLAPPGLTINDESGGQILDFESCGAVDVCPVAQPAQATVREGEVCWSLVRSLLWWQWVKVKF
ncbi:hypothetical protein Nepgr_006918 [Nepenthes gracilis]|uniref:Uncharacterized protein n=1 Tax=Nepenthes gracilis TaxID=150966 RepID=A0AAD3S600_NEPGR|nr:hypothetical protein Nepgr_006918 [Nepenthes gracilis]